MEKDMTHGSPAKVLLNFTVPVLLGGIFQQFYSMADTIIVGKIIGTKALAAAGSTGTLSFLLIVSLLGMTTGFTVPTAQRFGAEDMAGMRKAFAMSGFLSLFISLLMTTFSMLGMKPLLQLMNTPGDIFQDAYTYIMIICAGITAQILYTLLSATLRALGNSKTPPYFLIFAAALNIILDIIFIVVFHMGVAGAAYATVFSQGVSGLLCLFYIVRKVPILRLKRKDWKIDREMMKSQLGIGLPMAFHFSITAIGTVLVQSALNTLGSTMIAAFTAGNKIWSIMTQGIDALETTIAVYIAQNLGAKKIQRIRQGFRASTWMMLIYCACIAVISSTVGKHLTVFFLSGDLTEIIPLVDIFLKCSGIFSMMLAIACVYRSGLQGMGYGFLPLLAGVCELIGRGVTAFIAADKHSFTGICLASPMAWSLASILLISAYFYLLKNLEQKQKETS